MLLWKRYLIAGIFFFTYSMLALYLSFIPPDCPPNTSQSHKEARNIALRKDVSTFEQIFIAGYNKTYKSFKSHFPGIKPASKQDVKAPTGNREELSTKNLKSKIPKPHYKKTIREIDVFPPDKLLIPGKTPSLVFYVWCGRRWMEYSHYMSILSVIKTLKPDSLIFYYDSIPIVDSWTYNTWFKELTESYPFFIPTALKDTDNACKGFEEPNAEFIHARLQKTGGIYISEFIMLDYYPLSYLNYDFMYGLYNNSKYAFVQAKQNMPVNQLAQNPLLKGYKTTRIKCQFHREYNMKKKSTTCVTPPRNFFPKDIWESPSYFAQLIRKYFYGSPEIRKPQKNYDVLIPNIAHIVWIGGGQMDFLFYLCVVSLVYVAKVDMVYIHGDLPPSGPYWERIRRNEKVKHIYREVPETVFGNNVRVLSHVTDVWRVDFMVKYGGIYVDTDTAFVRPLDRDIRAYDAVGTYDWTYWNHPFPDTINFGVAIGKKNAKYWHLFQESMKWFMDDDWSWNGLRQPYRIKERHPELVLINPHLQITCYQFRCHPTWWPNYHNESIHHLNSNSIKDWKKEAYAFHWTMPTPPELENEEALVSSKTMFADIGRYILHQAGILKSDNRTIVYPNGRELKLNVKTKS